MTSRDIKQARKAYRHFITDTLIGRRKVSARKRREYFESFPVQVRRAVIG